MNVDVVLNLIMTAVMFLVFLGTLWLLRTEKREARTVLFAFAVACMLLSGLYWLSYGVLRPGTRMPFAANEIAESAMFLLFGAALNTKNRDYANHKKDIFFTALFTLANVALWIAWSGEWVDDILTGLTIGYFFYALVVWIKQTNSFPKWEWRIICVFSLVLFGTQAAIFWVPEWLKVPFDYFCYAIMMGMEAFLMFRAFRTLFVPERTKFAVADTFAAYAWTQIALFMSSGAFYYVDILLFTMCIPMMLLALKKEATAV